MKIAIVGFFSALLGALAGGLMAWRLLEPGAGPPAAAGEARVTKLTLVDKLSRPAARLRLDDDGFVALEFLRLDSKTAVELRASRNGGFEALQFGPFNGENGQMFLSASPYGTSLFLGNTFGGPRLTLGAVDPGDVPSSGPADSWGLFFSGDKSFKQPDAHYPRWVREKR